MIFGDRVRLRAIERADLDTLYLWWNDPDLWTLIGAKKRLTSQDELLNWYEGELDKHDVALGRTLAIDDDEGHLVGTVWYGSYDAGDRQTTVGLYLGSEASRGQGLGTDALGTLIRYLFEELGLHKTRLFVEVDNAAAIAAYRKLGFVDEGRFREHRFYAGRWHDFLAMGLLAREFAAR
jgi:RimJ/RimL family protein N-acetyltransferase